MKTLSEALMDLAGRVKTLEDSAAAVRQKNLAALQARRQELEASIDREVREAEETTTEALAAAGSWWFDTKASVRRQLEAMRADFKKSQAQLVEKDAERVAVATERVASAALTLAGYCLDAAEWAVVRAGLARADADEQARAAARA